MEKPCLFCGDNAECNFYVPSQTSSGVTYWHCSRCGDFHLTRRAESFFEGTKITPRQKANISGWLHENQPVVIDSNNAERLKETPTPSLHERADNLLLALEKKTEKLGQWHKQDSTWLSLAWCIDETELDEIIAFLSSKSGRLERSKIHGTDDVYKITPAGWLRLEEIKKTGADSQQGFVAMWFDDSMTPVYNDALSKAIEDAGYKPHRVDQREHNNKIDDEIIAQIRRSRFVVADFTGQRGGVYYEAGFAQGLRLEVFWTCRKDEIEKLHFDIRQFNCIDWESDKLDDFRKRLANRIESVLGKGTYRP